MQRDPRAFLWDVQQAAGAITQFTAGLDAAGYRANPLIRSAVERQFEIIGEALNRLSKEAPDLADRVPNLRKIVGFRNVLIHGYAVIDDGVGDCHDPLAVPACNRDGFTDRTGAA